MKRGAFLKDAVGAGILLKIFFCHLAHPRFLLSSGEYLVCGFQALPNLVSLCSELAFHIVSVFLSTW